MGMHFLPVRGLRGLLVAQHETRVRDYLAYDRSAGASPEWREIYGTDTTTRMPMSVLRPDGWEHLPNLPLLKDQFELLQMPPDAAAGGINFHQAQRFCAWLTWTEQKEGRISSGEHYRLPTDDEWSLLAGLPAETRPATQVEKRHLSLPKTGKVHPWGHGWPPPRNFANYAGLEARAASHWPSAWLSLPGANDDFPRNAPPARFAENENGLFDVWGNLWEWCDSKRSLVSNQMTLRGGSWVDGGYPAQLRIDFRRFERPNARETTLGFRCVLVVPDLR